MKMMFLEKWNYSENTFSQGATAV